jgi:uncharacterized protein YegJ (DUF2314 family)
VTNGVDWRLKDAEARNEAAPDSFFIPSRAKRESLGVGDRVKLLFEGSTHDGDEVVERMWVEVVSVRAGIYEGELAHEASEIRSIRAGERVTFGPEHVAAYLWTPEELGYDAGEFAWVRTESSMPRAEHPARVSMRPTDLRATEGDSGWIIGRGDETASEYTDDEVFRWIDLGWLADLFPELEPVFQAGEGDWRWDPKANVYARIA